MVQPLKLDIASLQRAYDAGVTVAQIVDVVGSRIEAYEKVDSAVWICREDPSRLKARALALDRLSAEERYALPLFGVPFAVKDNIDVKGLPTTAGCPGYAYQPADNAAIVEALVAAGAVCVGKTNLDQFATGLVGTRSPYGAPRCVFNEAYISGGSSSGSAVAVAAGLVSFALGTDTAGSGRVPAAINNIVGLKPTPGNLSLKGIVPACRSLDCPSVFALDSADGAYVYKSILDFGGGKPPYGPGPSRQLSGVLGVLAPSARNFCGDEAAAILYAEGMTKLKGNGFVLKEIDYAPFEAVANLLYNGPWVAERYAAVGEAVERNIAGLDGTVQAIILGGKNYSAVDAFQAQYRLEDLRADCLKQFEGLDALVLPTCPTVYKVSDVRSDPVITNGQMGLYTNFVNLLGLCAIAVPAGFRLSNGVPFGVTVMARGGGEGVAVRLAGQVHRLLEPTTGRDRTQIETAAAPGHLRLAVVGAHLRGQPLNHQLVNLAARFVEQSWSAPDYGLFALEHLTPVRPAMIRKTGGGGEAIELELWDIPEEKFHGFFRGIAPPLGLGTVELFDGRLVNGFIAEPVAAEVGRDISALKRWRGFVAAKV